MALRPVDRLLAGYLGFVTVVIAIRGPLSHPAYPWLLAMHGLFGIFLYLTTRLRDSDRVGRALHDLYPLVMLLPLYTEIGLLNPPVGDPGVLGHDAVIQQIEALVFGGQISYTWIRTAPSVFWSGLLHLAYFSYYPIVLFGPLLVWMRGNRAGARTILLSTMVAFTICYGWFVLYPVAGPNYAFPHPVGPVREVWSAQLVYRLLISGSSFGAAFPSSHVAATTAATLAVHDAWRGLGRSFLIPAALLTVATVYCQMHYGIDAAAGLVTGVLAWVVARRIVRSTPA